MSNSFNNLPDSVLLEMLGPTSVDQPKEYTNELLQYLSDQELSNQVDTKVGSPANVRAAVSAAQTKEDKLNTLRKYYPDALPVEAFDPINGVAKYGRGNYVYQCRNLSFASKYFYPKTFPSPVIISKYPSARRPAAAAASATAAPTLAR